MCIRPICILLFFSSKKCRNYNLLSKLCEPKHALIFAFSVSGVIVCIDFIFAYIYQLYFIQTVFNVVSFLDADYSNDIADNQGRIQNLDLGEVG